MSLEFDPEVRSQQSPEVTERQAKALSLLKYSPLGLSQPYGHGGEVDAARKAVWAIPPADTEQGKKT
ncbi:MAG: hypothetical protein WAS36_01505 [Candidatus Saccharimonadales bacterium]